MRKPLSFILALAISGLALTGCGATIQDRALSAAQIVHTSLATTQDAEDALCGQTPAEPTKCPSPAAAQIGLTDAKHQAINAVLAKSFRGEVAVITSLQQWTSGDMPITLKAAVANLQADIESLRTILPPGATGVLNLISTTLANVASLLSILGGGK